MIIELENEEKDWIQKNKELRQENNLVRQILTDDLNITIPTELQKKNKDENKDKKKKKDRKEKK